MTLGGYKYKYRGRPGEIWSRMGCVVRRIGIKTEWLDAPEKNMAGIEPQRNSSVHGPHGPTILPAEANQPQPQVGSFSFSC